MSSPVRPQLRSLRRTFACLLLAACASPALAEDFVYVVQPGDNPWNLTRRYLKGIDYWPRIQDYNRILEPETIQPGSVLRIPVAWMRGERGGAQVIDVRGDVEAHRAGRSEARGDSRFEGRREFGDRPRHPEHRTEFPHVAKRSSTHHTAGNGRSEGTGGKPRAGRTFNRDR